MNILNPTGGLIYHWRARRYCQNMWTPFRQSVQEQMTDWNPTESELLVLGPSGGYTLPEDFLLRFKKVHLYDPDISARFFFRRNHPKVATVWSHRNLIFHNGKYRPQELTAQLDALPDTAVLFANLIGQLPLLNQDLNALRSWWNDLKPTLKQRSWFSYHDLYSFSGNVDPPDRLESGPALPQLARWSKQRKIDLQITDHGTYDLFTEAQVNLVWKISPKRTHIVGVASNKF